MITGSSIQAMIFTGPLHFSHSLMYMLNTRLSRRAQVMAARCSIGVRSSESSCVVSSRLAPLPRLVHRVETGVELCNDDATLCVGFYRSRGIGFPFRDRDLHG